MRVSTLILCPIPEEYAAVKSYLSKVRYYQQSKSGRRYTIGRYGKKRIALIRTGSGHESIGQSVHIGVKDMAPKYIFLVGTAGGVVKVKVGDIVVGTAAYPYEWGREKEDKFQVRPKMLEADQQLLNYVEMTQHSSSWTTNDLSTTNIKVWEKPIASGSKVIESKRGMVFSLLRDHYNDAVALEMEAYAFHFALRAHPDVKGLNIRSISDLLEDKSELNIRGSKQLASKHAAHFVFAFIDQLEERRYFLPLVKRVGIATTLCLLLILCAWVVLEKDRSIFDFSNDELQPFLVKDTLVQSEPAEESSTYESSVAVLQNPTESNSPSSKQNDRDQEDSSIPSELDEASSQMELPTSSINTSSDSAIASSKMIDTIVVEERNDISPPTRLLIQNCKIVVFNKEDDFVNPIIIYRNGEKIGKANDYISLFEGKNILNLKYKNGLQLDTVVVLDTNSPVKPTLLFYIENFRSHESKK